ncbi:MAG: helix-turn-helix domain-containing protein [Trebonia sp.]
MVSFNLELRPYELRRPGIDQAQPVVLGPASPGLRRGCGIRRRVGPAAGTAAPRCVGRRRLEAGFAREIGLTPKTVARIARFQDAVQVLAAPPGTFAAAAARGYADQPHFNREIRAMAGITPSELRALVQYTGKLPG